jgi:hypothetical protein
MSESIPERIRHYVLDGSDRDLRLGVSAVRAGVEVASANGFFNVMEPSVGFDIHASAVAALKSRLVGTGVADGSEVDELERSLRQAASGETGWLTSPFMLDLTLRKPL